MTTNNTQLDLLDEIIVDNFAGSGGEFAECRTSLVKADGRRMGHCFLLIAIAMVVTAHAAQTSLFDGEG